MRTSTLLLSFAASAAILFSGCGAGASDVAATTDTASAPAAVVTVERGPVLDANVTDANGMQAYELGNGQYAFDAEPNYPITAVGGYIDVNRNSKVDPGEVKNTLKLESRAGDVVTIATTLGADKNVTQLLESAFELTPEEIASKTPGSDKRVEALSNAVYAYAMEHDISDLSELNTTTLEQLKQTYRVMRDEYENDDRNASEHEAALMQQLHMPTLDDADAQEVQEKIKNKLQEKMEHQEELHNGSSSSMGAMMDDMKGDAENQASSAMEQFSSDASSMQSGFSSSMGSMIDGMEEEVGAHASEDMEGENHSESNNSSSAMMMSDEENASSSSFDGGMNGGATSSMMNQFGFSGFGA